MIGWLLARGWGRVVVAGALVAIISAPFVVGWKIAGKIHRLEAEVLERMEERDKALEKLKRCGERVDVRDKALEISRASSLKAAHDRELYRQRYEEARARPPEIVTRYREAVAAAPAAIESTDCNEATLELLRFAHHLAELERGNQ